MAQENQPDAITIVRGRWSGWVRFGDHGITFRNFTRTGRIGWDEVRWFRDGQWDAAWALAIELRDGRVVTAGATSSGKPAARPETLRAIRQAAERHAIPAVLTGRAANSGPLDAPGLYTDPGGKLGLREWSGTEWSSFLHIDPASSGPEGEKGPARVWSPIPETVQQKQWDDAASRARRARILFACSLVVTAGAAIVTVVLYTYYLSKPHPNLAAAEDALFLTSFSSFCTWVMGKEYNRRKKTDQAGKAAAGLAGAVDSTISPHDDQGECLVTRTPVDDQPPTAVTPAPAEAPRTRCLECGAERAEATQVCARCGAP